MSSHGKNAKSGIDVAYVAKLARIALTEEEIQRLGGQLGDILDYIDTLNEVDTEDVPPMSHVLPLENIYREDAVGTSLPVDEVLDNAPSKKGNFFKVPKIIE